MTAEIRVRDLICSLNREDKSKLCTTLSARISDALIKVASTRIFAEPEQSFMELPVNSIDSYNLMIGKKQVGKFGMGFFSILYWLAENPNRVLTIISQYRENNQPFTYQVTLNWTPTGLILTRINPQNDFLPKINTIPGEYTGSKITLDCRRAPLTTENISRINKHMERLSNITGVALFYNSKLINGEIVTKNILMTVDASGMTIIDNAQGISIRTLNEALLIPSSSSKKRIVEIISETQEPIVKFNNSKMSKLVITVSDVSIITIEKEFKLFNPGFSFLIRMPSSTTLPVARDDIIYNTIEEKNISEQLQRVALMSMKHFGDLTVFLGLLDNYTQYSQQLTLFNIVSRLNTYILTYPDIIFIPTGYEVYNHLKKHFPQSIFVTHPYPLLYNTEKQIDLLLNKYSNQNIFKLKNIITLPLIIDAAYETGGLSRYMFVKKSYVDSNPQYWSRNLISLSKDTMLIPNSITVSENTDYTSTSIKDLILELPGFEDAFNVLIMTWTAKTQNLIFVNGKKTLITQIVNLYPHKNPEDMIRFVTHLNNKVSNIKFEYAYGASPIFAINGIPLLFGEIPPNIKDSIEERYKQNVIYSKLDDIFSEVERRLAYWYVNIWMDKPHGIYQIPGPEIFSVGFQITTFIDYQLLEEVLEGLRIALSEPEILVFIHLLKKLPYKGEYNKGLASFCINQIRHRASSEELKEIVVGALLGFQSGNIINVKIVNPILESLKLYLSIGEIQTGNLIRLPGRFTFTCKSLINYIFNNDKEFVLNDLQLINEYNKTFKPESVKLQMVEIAVNEGTTKDFMQAVLTELIQNSIDAIRSTERKNGRIDVNIRKDNFSITDNVGIPDSAFLALLIPFLSTKDPNDPNVTGEMGTGFFNVYRQPLSQLVTIDTILNKRRVTIEATPLVQDSKVYDINYSINILNSSENNRTTITIYFNPNTQMIIQSVTDAYIYTLNYLGFTGINTYLNGNLISQNKRTILEDRLGSIYLTDDQNIQSFVMTNNVPFSPLSLFSGQFSYLYRRLLNDGNTRIIINFNKNVYTPSQSRTKVNIPFELEKSITEFINDGLYLAILAIYVNNEISFKDSIIENSTSEAPIDQLKFTSNTSNFPSYADPLVVNLTNIMYFYVSYLPNLRREIVETPPMQAFSGMPIRELINIVITNLSIIKATDIKGLFTAKNIMWNAIEKWFSNKTIKSNVRETVVVRRTVTPGSISTEVKTDEPQAKSSPFYILQPFVDIFWNICKDLIEKGIIVGVILKDRPEIVIGTTVNDLQGFYKPDQNIVFLNEKSYNQNSIIRKIIEFKNLSKINIDQALINLRNDIELATLFAPNLPLVTFIHELLHAIQSEDHTSSTHGVTHISINGIKNLSFDDTAIEIYQKVLESGIMTRYLSS